MLEISYSRFMIKRLHSIFGVFLVFFLIEHLWTNALASLTHEGEGFVSSVNFLHAIPLLGLVEVVMLALPFAIHIIWGVWYTLHTRMNITRAGGSRPTLGFSNNWAFTLHRVTALIILVGVLWHVYDMRFKRYPVTSNEIYAVRISQQLADKEHASVIPSSKLHGNVVTACGDSTWEAIKEKDPINPGEVWIESATSGEAVLWNVREVFSSTFAACLYSIFVLCTAFHAFHGLYTAFFTWGIFVETHKQHRLRFVTLVLMCGLSLLGLIAIWGLWRLYA